MSLLSPSPLISAALPLYQEAAQRLRLEIFGGALKAGDWVDESRYTAAWGVSRTPLREAIKLLASEGLIEMKPRRGAYVASLGAADLGHIYHLLALLEVDAAHSAAQRLTDAQLTELQTLHQVLENAGPAAQAALEHSQSPANRAQAAENKPESPLNKAKAVKAKGSKPQARVDESSLDESSSEESSLDEGSASEGFSNEGRGNDDQAALAQFFAANEAFHLALLRMAHNPWREHMVWDLRKIVKLSRAQSLQQAGRVAASLAEHRTLLAALQKRDAAAAGAAMQAHLSSGLSAAQYSA